MLAQGGGDFFEKGKVPVRLRFEGLVEPPDAVGDVADHAGLREIDGIHLGGGEVDVDDLALAGVHEEGRLFHHVVADVENEVGGFEGAVGKVVGGDGAVAEEERVGLVDHALAHLGGDEGDALLVHEGAQHLRGHLAVGGGTDQQHGVAGLAQQFEGAGDGLVLDDGAAVVALDDRRGIRPSRATSSGSSRWTAPGRSSSARRKALRTGRESQRPRRSAWCIW